MHFWCKTSICPYRNPLRISFICSEWYDRETFKKHLDLLDIHLYMVCWMTSLIFRKQDCYSHFMVYFYSWTKKISSNLDKYGITLNLNLNFWQDVCDFCWWRRHLWWMKYSTYVLSGFCNKSDNLICALHRTWTVPSTSILSLKQMLN